MCSEISPPRLSLSNDDVAQLHVLPMKQNSQQVPCKNTTTMLLNNDDDDDDSNSEFEFITTSNNVFEFESSSADELFSNGVILPIQIQERKTATNNAARKHMINLHHHTKLLPPRPSSSFHTGADKMKKETIIRELLELSCCEEYEEKKNNKKKKKHPRCSSSSSFWGFTRSKSLNCETKKSLICSLPLLSRSNSTGSVQNNQKRMSSINNKSSSNSWSCSSLNYLFPVQKSAASGKIYGHGDGIRISPVLNVPTPYVSKGSSNLFPFGSFFSVGKVKKNK
ncbi:hypothetical protein HN51_008762 [Arachis hypogaea]|uniref:uncharacterized protein n=1 Tax=Arachis hypogaea TaxID=3818 RepID=UPI000DED081D|nr:uncharacterized protein LOC112802234 [Arachis hypogaea]QHO43105.1 uncharacterized protein DS421_5g159970 [Arachis hypogaea]